MYNIFYIIVSYLIGSIQSAVIVAKLMGLPDPRSYGSKNPGTTNIMRSGNKIAGAITLLSDTLKGFLPVFFCNIYSTESISFVATFLVIGNCYPFHNKFHGGKGVATSLGVLFGIDYLLGLFAILVWILIFLIFRKSWVSGISAITLSTLFSLFVLQNVFTTLLAINLIIIYRHQQNFIKA